MNPENNQPVQYNQKPAISTPSKPASSETPAKKSPSKVLLLVLGFVIIIITVGAYVLGMQKNAEKNPQVTISPAIAKPTPTPDATSEWQTYTNSKYGYTLSYAPNARLKQFSCSQRVAFEKGDESFVLDEINSQNKECGFFGGSWPIGIEIRQIDVNYQSDKNYSIQKSSITVAGLPGTRYDFRYIGDPLERGSGLQEYTQVVLQKDNNYFVFTLSKLDYEATFDQILSTFTFTNATPAVSTSTAKTYTDAKYAFSFAVPGGYFTEVKDYPENDERLVYIKKTDAPVFGYTLTIKPNWDNTGYDLSKVKEVSVGGVAAKRVDPPSLEEKDMENYQTNVYFEYGGRVYVFTCGHNWVEAYVDACGSILESFTFSK